MQFECNKCEARVETQRGEARTPMHPCKGMKGMVVPMMERGVNYENVVNVREDYVGDEIVTTVDGVPVMSVTTKRDEGEDCTVYAPCATAEGA